VSAVLRRIVLAGAALLIAAPGARAELLRKVVDELIDAPTPVVAVEQANDAAHAQFKTLLATYDRQIEQRPWDAIARLDRCRFMRDFAANYQIAGFATEIGEQAQECMQEFERSFAGHPEARLRQLQADRFGEELMEQGEALLADPQVHQTWTSGQLARLYTLLARDADGEGNAEQALKYALLALERDEESDVRLIAAAHLIDRGNKLRALEILSAPIESVDYSENGWELLRKMDLLVQAGAAQDAIALYPLLSKVQYYNHAEAADTLLDAGASELARKEIEKAMAEDDYGTDDEGQLFRLEFEHGTAEAALAAYEAWRDLGWEVDPLGINRAALLGRDASLPLQPRDFLSVFAFGALCILIAMVAALPIVAVHYRGLVVRAKSGEPYPRSDWTLRTAWLGLTAFFIMSVVSLYFAGTVEMSLAGESLWEFEPTPEQAGRTALAGSLLGILAMLPFAFAYRRVGNWWSTQWSIGRCLAVAAIVAVALRVPLLIAWAVRPEAVRMHAPDDLLWQAMGSVAEQYGLIVALWMLAVAAPVIEEFLFRGLLYRAFATHLRPLWANVLQAALFSAMHLENVQGSILLFVLGLALGTVTRRSGGLLAAMALHSIFNLVAGLIVLGVD
jgi:uncharacterized protein